MKYFTVYPDFDPSDPVNYFTLVSHICGHANAAHLLGNMMILLLVGPLMEERYGSRAVLAMILVTALVTGILVVLFFSKGLLGASGVVFMFITLSSFNNLKEGYIPLTFVIVFVMYVFKEILLELTVDDGVSHLAHILGGSLGSLFGWKFNRKKNNDEEGKSTVHKSETERTVPKSTGTPGS